MIDYGIDPAEAGFYNEAKGLVGSLAADLRRVVEKAESEIEFCRGSSVDLERAYFHDVVELLFNRTVEGFGKLMAQLTAVSVKNQLREELVLNIKRSAAMTVIDSDICQTVLMDDFSELMARFVKDLERTARRTQIAA